MKAVLSENNVRFEYMDITKSMLALKTFLVVRDTSEAYSGLRGKRTIGIPMLMVDGTPYVLDGPDHAKALIDSLELRG